MLKVIDRNPVTLFYMGRSPMGILLYPVHCFLLGDILIDTGTSRAGKNLMAALENRRIAAIVNTHHHEDHVGNNRALQERYGIPVFAHPLALPLLADPRLNRLRPYQRVVWAWPEPSRGTPVGDRIDTEGFSLEVIASPGHCDDHICLYERRRRWLFTGDLFCGTSFSYLRSDENYSVILETLKRLSALDIDTIFCSLKGAVANGGEALRRKIRRMEELRDRVMDLHARGTGAPAIRKRLLGGEGMMGLVTGGHYSKQNTVDSIISGKRPDGIG
ncbi:MAG: MBL fold metallo-hydrolase [Spirochaetes bacterium]|nr:MBL fold metallo-hydrolase [Spirochaetota bacterium]